MMASNAARPVWVKQAEEAKLKEEQEKSAAAWEAFNSTFKDVNVGATETLAEQGDDNEDSDSEEDEAQILANKPIGPVDPGKCTAAGTGVAGGAAGAAASFVVVMKDGYGRRIPYGGAQIKVKVTPAAGASGGEVEQEAVVKDHDDGTYTATYAVAKRGNYVVSVECNGMPILNSPFPVFFSGGTATVPLSTPAALLTSSTYGNGVPPNPYLGGIPGMYQTGASMPGLSQMPLAPSAAAMAAAQAIMAARAYEAAQAREVASAPAKDSKEDEAKQKEILAKTLQVSNLSSVLSADQLQKLFSFCGTVSECKIDDSKQLAYIEYTKPEEAKAALALNNMAVGGRHINVEMAKSLPKKPTSATNANGLPVMMQQAVAIQQFQFQQALLVQQAVASQHAALQAATAKTAQETAAARAAEISKSLNITVTVQDVKEADAQVKRSSPHPRKSKSRSPIRYRHRHRSRSMSRSPIRYRRGRRSRSRSRERPRHGYEERGRAWFYRSGDDYYRSQTRHFQDRERDYEHKGSQRRSPSRNKRKAGSRSPKPRKEQSRSPRQRTEDYSAKARSTHSKSSVKDGHHKRDRDFSEKTSSRRKEPASPSARKGEKSYDEGARLSASPKASSPRSRKTLDLEAVEAEEPARDHSGGFEVKRSDSIYDESDEKQRDVSYDERVKASEVEERGQVDTKERRHSERKHRKDEDIESREKRKRRHKHRTHRSSSESADGRPIVDGSKSRTDREDGSGHRRSSKRKSRLSRSPSFSNSRGN